jgi:hypothetical protein
MIMAAGCVTIQPLFPSASINRHIGFAVRLFLLGERFIVITG